MGFIIFVGVLLALNLLWGLNSNGSSSFLIKLGVFYGLGGILIVGRVEREERREVRALVG